MKFPDLMLEDEANYDGKAKKQQEPRTDAFDSQEESTSQNLTKAWIRDLGSPMEKSHFGSIPYNKISTRTSMRLSINRQVTNILTTPKT